MITELKPCWVGLTSRTLVLGWRLISEERVAKDDSVEMVWAQHGDCVGLMAE